MHSATSSSGSGMSGRPVYSSGISVRLVVPRQQGSTARVEEPMQSNTTIKYTDICN